MRLQCALLGLVQGITEFLPVSSSGHLVIVQELLGWSDPALSFDVMLHLSTMTATLLFFRKEVVRIARDWFSGLFSIRDRDLPGWRYGWSVILGTLVTVFIALLSRPLAEVLFSSPLFAGFALIITGFVLRYGSRIVPRDLPVSLSTGIKVGLAQGLSILPGISRSGMTIVTGLRCGLSPGRHSPFPSCCHSRRSLAPPSWRWSRRGDFGSGHITADRVVDWHGNSICFGPFRPGDPSKSGHQGPSWLLCRLLHRGGSFRSVPQSDRGMIKWRELRIPDGGYFSSA